jgi:leucyl aminopeptidase
MIGRRALFDDVTPLVRTLRVDVLDTSAPPGDPVPGVLVATDGPLPERLGVGRDALRELGFDGAAGQTAVLVGPEGRLTVAVGIGADAPLGPDAVRDAAAAFSLAVPRATHLALELPHPPGDVEPAAQAAVEGAALARYTFRVGGTDPQVPLEVLTLVTSTASVGAARAGADRALVLVAACELGRDLANTPAGMLTARRLAEIAQDVGASHGLDVEVFDEDDLHRLGCGGLLGINRGSVEPPRMVKVTYRPAGAVTGRLTLVGKGIMFDSGGLALKPGDAVHATMKNDMSGAGVILAAMTALRALGCTTQVTGYLMCTDNMPSGSAITLGDVVTIRGGTTVEVVNTDAEGRVVMADALVLATEEPTDAILDVATLTGACMRALGTEVAGVMGTSQPLVEQVRASAARTDEPVWQLPLHRRYRGELDSPIADLRNLGGANAGAITAALFLAEFVGDVPWAHLDIAGTAQSDARRGWRTKGATGFGTRLLIDLAVRFTPPTT